MRVFLKVGREGTRKPHGGNTHYFLRNHQTEYSPAWPDGKKHARNVYAHSEAECEKLLAEMIAEMKAEIATEKERLKATQKAG